MRSHPCFILVNSDYINTALFTKAYMKNLLRELISGSFYRNNIITFYFNSKVLFLLETIKQGFLYFMSICP